MIAAIIPARLESTRLPHKLLLSKTGRPLLQHTYEAVKAARVADRVLITTSDKQIEKEATAFGAEVVRSWDCNNGTLRVAAAASLLGLLHPQPTPDIIINVQGDEPEVTPEMLSAVVKSLPWSGYMGPELPGIATLACPINGEHISKHTAPQPMTKVVLDHRDRALYFSRSIVPWVRYGAAGDYAGFRHIGIYAFKPHALQAISRLKDQPSRFETEDLEQLKWLEYGHKIVVGIVQAAPNSIDTQEDYDAFCERYLSWQQPVNCSTTIGSPTIPTPA